MTMHQGDDTQLRSPLLLYIASGNTLQGTACKLSYFRVLSPVLFQTGSSRNVLSWAVLRRNRDIHARNARIWQARKQL